MKGSGQSQATLQEMMFNKEHMRNTEDALLSKPKIQNNTGFIYISSSVFTLRIAIHLDQT